MDTCDLDWMDWTPATPAPRYRRPAPVWRQINPATLWPRAPKPEGIGVGRSWEEYAARMRAPLFLWSGVTVVGYDAGKPRVRVKAGSRPL